mgnify:CR=1 FL=1
MMRNDQSRLNYSQLAVLNDLLRLEKMKLEGHTKTPAQIIKEKKQSLIVSPRHTRHLRNVKAALRRMEVGTYGECMSCGTALNYKSLLANPTRPACEGCCPRVAV